METQAGTRFIIIEQKGKDIWRGKSKSVTEAIENDEASLGVDRVLLQRAMRHHDITTVMIVIEEQRKIFLASAADFFDENLSKSRANFRGRSNRLLPYSRFTQKYLGPNLQKRKRSTRKSA